MAISLWIVICVVRNVPITYDATVALAICLLYNIHTHTDTLVGRQVVGRQVSLLLAIPPSPPYPCLCTKIGRLVGGLKPSSQRSDFFLSVLLYFQFVYCLLTTFTLIAIVNCVKCAQRKILCDTTTRARKR